MSRVHPSAVVDSIQRLFDAGTLATQSDRQLFDRFLAENDRSAFEVIVARHGPMVLSVCRRVLDNTHDVDDAFQATFLILVQNGGSIRDRDALGMWLYGVVCRVAVRARSNSRQRHERERVGTEGSFVDRRRDDPVEGRELKAALRRRARESAGDVIAGRSSFAIWKARLTNRRRRSCTAPSERSRAGCRAVRAASYATGSPRRGAGLRCSRRCGHFGPSDPREPDMPCSQPARQWKHECNGHHFGNSPGPYKRSDAIHVCCEPKLTGLVAVSVLLALAAAWAVARSAPWRRAPTGEACRGRAASHGRCRRSEARQKGPADRTGQRVLRAR